MADQSVPEDVRGAIEGILAYMWPDESNDYEQAPDDERENHVFEIMLNVERWLSSL
jgi:hypothetical protein